MILPDVPRRVMTGSLLNSLVIRQGPIADYTGDGRVDLRDYAAWAQDYGKVGNSQSDLDHNGKVDYRDMKAFFDLMSKDVARRAAERDSDGN